MPILRHRLGWVGHRVAPSGLSSTCEEDATTARVSAGQGATEALPDSLADQITTTDASSLTLLHALQPQWPLAIHTTSRRPCRSGSIRTTMGRSRNPRPSLRGWCRSPASAGLVLHRTLG